jgi:hypothetical protein
MATSTYSYFKRCEFLPQSHRIGLTRSIDDLHWDLMYEDTVFILFFHASAKEGTKAGRNSHSELIIMHFPYL